MISLVGAGPGDPELLTLGALRRLRRAQVVVYDALVSPGVLAKIPERARRVYAGKRDGRHELPQEEINRLLVGLGRRGLRVVRLKGGDPFVFGRGSEEAEALSRAGVPWELVPGVSSCLAVPACAGIPATDRRLSSMLTVVTGHRCLEEGGPGVDWKSLSPRGTLVVMMGLSALPELSRRLIALGWDPRTPAAALASVGWPGERTAAADLESLPREASRRGLSSPAVIVVGKVVSMRRWLLWRRPGGGDGAGQARARARRRGHAGRARRGLVLVG